MRLRCWLFEICVLLFGLGEFGLGNCVFGLVCLWFVDCGWFGFVGTGLNVGDVFVQWCRCR